MRHLLYLFAAIFLSFSSHANEMQQIDANSEFRIDVEPQQIHFMGKDIYVYSEGNWIPVECIYSDVFGLHAKPKNPYHGRWICPRCRYNNNPWDDYCQNWLPNGEQCLYPRLSK